MAIPEIAAALSATSNAIQILKGLNEASKQVEVNRAVLELQGQLIELSSKIITIQSEYDALTKAKTDVEKELVEERKKAEDRSQYELVSLGSGFAYRYIGKSRPPHHLCAACFDSGFKSILHEYETGLGPYCECKRVDKHSFSQ